MLRPLPPTTSGRESFRGGVLIERTVTRARLDDRSTARCVRADVTAIPLVDSPVFSRSHAFHLRNFEIPLPSSGDRQMSSQASARFWLSMTLFGPQRPRHFVFCLPFVWSSSRNMFRWSACNPNSKRSHHWNNIIATRLCNSCKPLTRGGWQRQMAPDDVIIIVRHR